MKNAVKCICGIFVVIAVLGQIACDKKKSHVVAKQLNEQKEGQQGRHGRPHRPPSHHSHPCANLMGTYEEVHSAGNQRPRVLVIHHDRKGLYLYFKRGFQRTEYYRVENVFVPASHNDRNRNDRMGYVASCRSGQITVATVVQGRIEKFDVFRETAHGLEVETNGTRRKLFVHKR